MSFGSGVRRDWAAWLPLLFIGAMMFWTVALGLGGWSLMMVSDGALESMPPAPTATEPMPGTDAPQAQAAVDDIPVQGIPVQGIPVQGIAVQGIAVQGIAVQMEESQEPEDVNDNPGSAGFEQSPAWLDVSHDAP